MRLHLGRTALTAIILAEIGAGLGALLAWGYLVGRTWVWEAPVTGQGLLGAALWALSVGVPLGGLLAPTLGLTVLRRAPLWRVLTFPAVGAMAGLALGAWWHRGSALPVPPLISLLLAGGLVAGVVLARLGISRDATSRTGLVDSPNA